MKILVAQEGKIFAYKDNDQEIILGNILYLGIDDNGLRYYEVDIPQENTLETIEEVTDGTSD